jgi:hypothetical protein
VFFQTPGFLFPDLALEDRQRNRRRMRYRSARPGYRYGESSATVTARALKRQSRASRSAC